MLVVGVLALGGGVLFAATGGIGRIAEALGATMAGFVTDLTSTPPPSTAPAVLSDAPLLEPPAEPYTREPTVDLVGQVPAELAGASDHRIRIYVAIGDQQPGPITEIPIGQTARFLVPGVILVEGTNAFTATIVGPAGESEPSAAATYVLDATKPNIKLRTPKNGALVNARSVEINGQTQPRSALSFTNVSTGETVIGEADDSGNFKLFVPIGPGINEIDLSSTDPAGNVQVARISVKKGAGVLAAALTSSFYRIRTSKLPEKVRLEVRVTDPDGQPLAGARVTFSLAVPGIPVIASRTIETGTNGGAAWSATIPKGSSTGVASAVVIVKAGDLGETTDRTSITIAK